MILTCPTCASRYFVDESKLGPLGRTVRCAACGGSWRAEPEGDPLDLGLAADAPEVDPAPTADALSRSFRQQAEAKRRTRKAMAAGVVWAGVAASVAILLLMAVVFRIQVVRIWPRTAGVYAALRLPVNPLGLAPENVQAGAGLENGRAALVVTGAERNVEARPRPPAAVRVSLYDKGGARLVSRVIRPSPEPIAAGESRAFSVSFLDPPLSGVQVGVDFIVETPVRPVPPASRPTRISALRQAGATPIGRDLSAVSLARPRLAEPIAPDSPYALQNASRTQAR